MSALLTEADCTCTAAGGCDEHGDPGCRYCQVIDSEWPCPAEVGPLWDDTDEGATSGSPPIPLDGGIGPDIDTVRESES